MRCRLNDSAFFTATGISFYYPARFVLREFIHLHLLRAVQNHHILVFLQARILLQLLRLRVLIFRMPACGGHRIFQVRLPLVVVNFLSNIRPLMGNILPQVDFLILVQYFL